MMMMMMMVVIVINILWWSVSRKMGTARNICLSVCLSVMFYPHLFYTTVLMFVYCHFCTENFSAQDFFSSQRWKIIFNLYLIFLQNFIGNLGVLKNIIYFGFHLIFWCFLTKMSDKFISFEVGQKSLQTLFKVF